MRLEQAGSSHAKDVSQTNATLPVTTGSRGQHLAPLGSLCTPSPDPYFLMSRHFPAVPQVSR